MKTTTKVFLGIVLVFAMLVTGCSGDKKSATSNKEGKMKVGFVHIGSVKDGGWTQSHENGRLAMLDKFKDLETATVENVTD